MSSFAGACPVWSLRNWSSRTGKLLWHRLPGQEPPVSTRFGVAAAIGDLAIHQHAIHAYRLRLWQLERRRIADRRRIEHDDVGVRTDANFAAAREPELAGRQAGHLVDCGFQRKQTEISAVVSEHAWKCSPETR